jgi:hypothetical protein
MSKTFRKATAAVLITTLAVTSLPLRAEMVSTSAAIAEEQGQAGLSRLQQERADIVAFMARADVKTQLTRLGVDPSAANERVAALSDEQVQDLHGRIQQLPAGGDILGVVVFVFLVLLITDILGLTKVFPFTRSIRH